MANIRKWIAEARELEESGDLQGALAAYRKALVAQEETSGFADLSLYNGLGDLFLRAGDTQEAVKAYESAAADSHAGAHHYGAAEPGVVVDGDG